MFRSHVHALYAGPAGYVFILHIAWSSPGEFPILCIVNIYMNSSGAHEHYCWTSKNNQSWKLYNCWPWQLYSIVVRRKKSHCLVYEQTFHLQSILYIMNGCIVSLQSEQIYFFCAIRSITNFSALFTVKIIDVNSCVCLITIYWLNANLYLDCSYS